MKKLIYIIIMAIIFIPFNVKAEILYSGTSNGTRWTYSDDGTLNFYCQTEGKSCSMSSYFSDPPDTYNPNYVSDYRALKNLVKKVVFSNDIDNVGMKAFMNFVNLEEVILPKSMGDQIDDYAFYNCSKLKEIKMSDHFDRIGKYAFYGTGITKVELSKFTDFIDEHAFNEGTIITHAEGYDDLYAAGTAGKNVPASNNHPFANVNGHSCENEYYYSFYYDDDVFWELTKDGTLTIYGSGEFGSWGGSRIPFGCWKDKIKKIVINKQKEATLTKSDKTDNTKKLPNAVYGIYTNKSPEEITNNSLTGSKGNILQDCSVNCRGPENLEEIKLSNEFVNYNNTFFSAGSSAGTSFTKINI